MANISTPRAPQTRRALVWSVADTAPRVCVVSITLTCLPPSVCGTKTSFFGEKRVQCTVCVRACAYTCVRRFSRTCHQWRWIREAFPREKSGVRCSQTQLQRFEESDDAKEMRERAKTRGAPVVGVGGRITASPRPPNTEMAGLGCRRYSTKNARGFQSR